MRVNAISFHQYPLETAFQMIRSAGYSSTEVYLGHLLRPDSRHVLRSYKDYAQRMGLTLYGVAFDGNGFEPLGTEAERKKAVLHLRRYIDIAHELDAGAVIAWEGIRPADIGDKEVVARAVEVFREILIYAGEKKINIFLEPHPFTFGMNLDLLIEFFDRIDSPWLGILYDVCHFGVGRPLDYIADIARLGHRIHHIHFSDSDGQTSELHLPPGDGVLELQKVEDALMKIHYKGSLTADLYLHSQPADGAAKSLHYFQALQTRLGI